MSETQRFVQAFSPIRGLDEDLVHQLRSFAFETVHAVGLDAKRNGLDPHRVRAALMYLLASECLDMGDDLVTLVDVASCTRSPRGRAETDPANALLERPVAGSA